jgi:hypothetical protein
MIDSTAGHLVQIYRRRVRIAERQYPAPSARALAQLRELLQSLEEVDSETRIETKHPEGRVEFVVVAEGRVIGVLEYLDYAP